MIPYSRPKCSHLYNIPYPRVNCLKTIPFTETDTYIAHIWQYPPPPTPGGGVSGQFPRNLNFKGSIFLLSPTKVAGGHAKKPPVPGLMILTTALRKDDATHCIIPSGKTSIGTFCSPICTCK